jgi:CxxC motif-containing protein
MMFVKLLEAKQVPKSFGSCCWAEVEEVKIKVKKPITKSIYMECMMKFQKISYLKFFGEKSPKLIVELTKF